LKTKYIFKEALRGFNTAKLSTVASVFTITLSLILISIYLTLSINSGKLLKSIKDKVEIEVFLEDNINLNELNNLKDKIKTVGGIKTMSYISKEDAAKIFEKDFGKDMLEIFDYNPLPASLKINVYEEYKSLEKMNKIKNQIASFPKVSDIIFPEKNLELLEKNTSGLLFINLTVLVLITIISIFLVSNTIRLVIVAKSKIIETLSLLGATNIFIRAPFIIEGFIQGFLGGLFSIGILYLIFLYFNTVMKQTDLQLDFLGLDYLIYLLITGIFLGVFGSSISVGKFIKSKIRQL
jgi:cell division transport system permease protein